MMRFAKSLTAAAAAGEIRSPVRLVPPEAEAGWGGLDFRGFEVGFLGGTGFAPPASGVFALGGLI